MKRKVAAGGLGGAVALIVITIAESFGLKVDGELGSALTVITTFLIAYFVPEADTSLPVGSAEPPPGP